MNLQFDYPYKTRNDFLRDLVAKMVRRRHDLGITQEELNHRLGVADRLISKWECGTRTPASFHLYCWADALQSELTIVPKSGGILDLTKTVANDNLNIANDNTPPIEFEKMKSGT